MYAAPLSNTVGTKAALEEGAYLALHINQDNGKHRVEGDNDQCHQHALNQCGRPAWQKRQEQGIYPIGYDFEIKHNLFWV